jgi:hypothetical protein
MIKEYDDVKRYIDTMVSSKYLHCAVTVNEIYTEEYNALDVTVSGGMQESTDFFIDFKNEIKKEFNKIVDNFEMISVIPQQTTIIVYLRPILDIRSDKIHKIKSKIAV